MRPVRLETNPFQACLDDSLQYACYARERPTEQKAYSRTSILSSCLAIEALSNCCLEVLPYKGQQKKEFDRLPPLGKLDLFLSSRGMQPLDRGAAQGQSASKLMGLRHDFVHPRYQKRDFHDPESAVPSVKIEYDQVLGKRKGINDLTRTDAESICRKLVGFVGFFTEVANLSRDESLEIFSDRVIFDTGRVQFQGSWSDEALRAVRFLSLNMSWHPWYLAPTD